MAALPVNIEIKERLIEEIKKYPCLYDSQHKEYKNASYKTLLWDSCIGEALNMEGYKAKEMWRVLRDGYIRHRRAKSQPGPGKKYSKYRWSDQMGFLDDILDAKTNTVETYVVPELTLEIAPMPDIKTSPEMKPSPPITIEEHPVLDIKMSPPSTPTEITELNPDPLLTPIKYPTEEPEAQTSQPYSPSSPQAKKKKECTKDRVEKVIEYLKEKKKPEYDAVDYLFSSYAKTFRKLSQRKQIELKVSLARLFAEAELSDQVGDIPIKIEVDY